MIISFICRFSSFHHSARLTHPWLDNKTNQQPSSHPACVIARDEAKRSRSWPQKNMQEDGGRRTEDKKKFKKRTKGSTVGMLVKVCDGVMHNRLLVRQSSSSMTKRPRKDESKRLSEYDGLSVTHAAWSAYTSIHQHTLSLDISPCWETVHLQFDFRVWLVAK